MKKTFALKPRRISEYVIGIVTVIIASITASAQANPAQSSAPPLGFDVVSVKLNKSGAGPMKMTSPSDGDGVTFSNVPLFRVILYAYHINRFYQAIGLPAWSMTERYDITAKVADSDVTAYAKLSREQRMIMFQKVLADRFKLQVHRELRDTPAYALVPVKGGPKMKLATPGDTYPNGVKGGNDTVAHGVTIFITGPGELTGQGARVEDLAVSLSDYGRDFIGREVIDKSGLTDKYDFKLRFAPTQIGPDSDGPDNRPFPPQSAPSIFTAIQEQLGLRLQSTTAPEEFFIVDHLERPSEN